jgi:hypothetical protein
MFLSKPVFATISLGSSKHSFSVQILKFPRSDAPLLDKVQAFAYFNEVFRQHERQLTSLAIQQAYANNIPVCSSAAASEEANRIGSELHEAFFLVSNLSCLRFFGPDGTKVHVAPAPCDRKPSIAFVQFQSTVNPTRSSSNLASIPAVTVTFFLPLPQSPIPAKPQPTASASELQANQDATDTALAASNAVNTIIAALVAGGTIAKLDLTDATVVTVLSTTIVRSSSTAPSTASAATPAPGPATPYSTTREFFPEPSWPEVIVSPSVRRHLTDAAAFAESSFGGPLDFLDSQASFDAVFPTLDRTPLSTCALLTDPATADTASVAIQKFLAACCLAIFQTVIRLDYIGRHDFSSADHLQMTVKRLCMLTLDFRLSGRVIHGNPDMLFSQYLALIPLLPASHVNIWGLNLFTQFWAALGEDVTRRIACLPRYLTIYQYAFDLSTINTKDCQMSVFCEL